MKRKRNASESFSLVDEWFDECYNAEASLKGNPNSSHKTIQCQELSRNLPLSQHHHPNKIHIHSNAGYTATETSTNNTHLIGLVLHSMTDLNNNIIRKDHENYNSGVLPVLNHLSTPNIAFMPTLDGSHLNTLDQLIVTNSY